MAKGITLAPCGLIIERIEAEPDALVIIARPASGYAACLMCGHKALVGFATLKPIGTSDHRCRSLVCPYCWLDPFRFQELLYIKAPHRAEHPR